MIRRPWPLLVVSAMLAPGLGRCSQQPEEPPMNATLAESSAAEFQLQSSAFAAGKPIPKTHTGEEQDLSPPPVNVAKRGRK